MTLKLNMIYTNYNIELFPFSRNFSYFPMTDRKRVGFYGLYFKFCVGDNIRP